MTRELEGAASEYRKSAATVIGLLGVAMVKGHVSPALEAKIDEWLDKTDAASARLTKAIEQNKTEP